MTELDSDVDKLYNKVIHQMKRLLKVLTGHSSAIDSLERKLREMSESKKKQKKANEKPSEPRLLTDEDRLFPPTESGIDIQVQDHGDDEGLDGYQEPEQPPEYQDDIDGIESEGEAERQMMMSQIRMVEVDNMEVYNQYNVRIDDNQKLDINDSNELDDVSSEGSEGSVPDKKDE